MTGDPIDSTFGHADGPRERRLADLFCEYARRLEAGEDLDREEIRRLYPDMARELLRDLESFEAVGAELAPPQPLGTLGDYTLRRRIGRGGMGVVYEAWEGSMDRPVALKVLPPGIAADERALQRFVREAKTAGQLSHPNVVSVYAMGVQEQTPFYAMELIHGETLAEIVARMKTATRDAPTPFGHTREHLAFYGSVAGAFADVADGLQHAHSRGVVHRDIKPSNLILERAGFVTDIPSARLRILDFGLARLEGQESLSATGDVVGTPLYMSPEQARRKRIPVDHRTDVYSLGATLYEVLTLEPPFRGKDHEDTLSRIIQRDPRPPRQLNPRVPRDLETIVLKCLRKDPGDRYGTAEALGQDLRRFARGDAVEARAARGLERFVARVARHRARIVATALVVTVLLVTVAYGLSLWQRDRQARLERYEGLLIDGIAGLEVGFQSLPGEKNEGEDISLGIVYPSALDGNRVHIRRFHDEAVRCLWGASEAAPWRAEALVHLYRGLIALGEPDEASSVLGRALHLAPGFLPAILYRTHELSITDPVGSANAAKFLQSLEGGLSEDWERLWVRSHLSAARGDWDDVERIYDELIDEGRARAPYKGFLIEHLLKRGRIRLRRGNGQGALRDFLAVRERAWGTIAPALLVASTYYLLEDREQARLTLDESLRQFPGPDTVFAVAEVYTRFGETERALDLVTGAGFPRAECDAMRARILLGGGRAKEAAAAGQSAIAAGAGGPDLYLVTAKALIDDRRIEDGENLLREGLYRFPGHPGMEESLRVHVAYYRCRHQEVIRRLLEKPERERDHLTLGWCYYRVGLQSEALASFRKELELRPREPRAWFGLGFATARVGDDLAAAIPHFVQALVVTEGTSKDAVYRLVELYSPSRRDLFEEHWDRLDAAFSTAGPRRLDDPWTLSFRALTCLHKSEPDPVGALELAERGVEKANAGDAVTLSSLAEVLFERGDVVEAVRILERAFSVRMRPRAIEEQLVSYRRLLSPRLASCASVDAFIEGGWNKDCTDGDFSADREAACIALERESPELAAYLGCCLLDSAGELEEAATCLERLLLRGQIGEEAAVLRLARLEAGLGRRDRALALIEDRLLSKGMETLRAWEAWLSLSSKTPALSARELLDRPIFAGVGDAPPRADSVFASEVRWVLTRLAEDRAVRINCGGQRYKDCGGQVWEADCLFDGGVIDTRFAPRVTNTEDPPLYLSHRPFPRGFWLTPGYRIPLPDGGYDLTLHFVETVVNPYPARFAIVCEGETLEPDFLVGADGFGVAQRITHRIAVEGGALDLVFRGDRLAKVSAIEVREAATRQSE